jgi:hypothetical protein
LYLRSRIRSRRVHSGLTLLFCAIGAAVFWCAPTLQSQSPTQPQSSGQSSSAPPAAPVDYERQIQPIFERNCYECHGPEKNKGHLQLHERTLALERGGESGPVIVPGNSKNSLLVQRILGLGDDDQMPKKKAPLAAEEIALIRAWIEQGATWPDSPGTTAGAASAGAANIAGPPRHWAYVKPRRPDLPQVAHAEWVRNPVDRFVLARLEHEGLVPSREADRTTLLRRITLDLIGLPPTPQEIDAFLQDTQPDAYDRVVDRLLASPAFGERWARPWLDLARFADTNGHAKDERRSVWKYRDWIIDALNADMPFDQFTIEQIAGDMLPDATASEQIASGFSRNSMTNREGGVDPEEALFESLIDRVNTLSTVWLGSTIGCAQCHNHKYDPFTQKDYYRLMAFFQNTTYTVQTIPTEGTFFNEAKLELATPEQAQRREVLERDVAKFEKALTAKTPALAAAQSAWEVGQRALRAEWTALKPATLNGTGDVTLTASPDGSVLASGANPAVTTYTIIATTPLSRITGLRLEALPDPSLPRGGPGRDPYGHFHLTGVSVDAAPIGGASQSFAITFNAINVDDGVGEILPELFFNRTPFVRARKGQAWTINAVREDTRLPRQAVMLPSQPFGFAGGTRLTITLAHLDGALPQGLGRFRLSVTGSATPARIVELPARVRPALDKPAAQRTAQESADLLTQFRATTPLLARTRNALTEARKAVSALQIPTTLVMREKPTFERPSTYVHQRGAFTAKGARVYASVPAALNPMPDSQPMNRLGLAHWLVDENNPLVARVAVNRLWEQLFGRGIVETSEDFGTQGAAPTHPELLDWLATTFMAEKWSQKAILRLFVTSATYRQDSRATPALIEKDPYNRLLARGPRFRLEAEMIRDVTLAAAGLLSPKMWGPSVFPPQPEGIWNVAGGENRWVTSEGENRYRRGIYTFVRRTAHHPVMAAFDAPSREYCTVRRVRTNTPLQALVLLNEESSFEAAQTLARRLLIDRSAGSSDESRLAYGMRLTVARTPTAGELADLRQLLDRERQRYTTQPEAAVQLVTPYAPPPAWLMDTARPGAAADLAAWTIVSNVLLNLDETLTKE